MCLCISQFPSVLLPHSATDVLPLACPTAAARSCFELHSFLRNLDFGPEPMVANPIFRHPRKRSVEDWFVIAICGAVDESPSCTTPRAGSKVEKTPTSLKIRTRNCNLEEHRIPVWPIKALARNVLDHADVVSLCWTCICAGVAVRKQVDRIAGGRNRELHALLREDNPRVLVRAVFTG